MKTLEAIQKNIKIYIDTYVDVMKQANPGMNEQSIASLAQDALNLWLGSIAKNPRNDANVIQEMQGDPMLIDKLVTYLKAEGYSIETPTATTTPVPKIPMTPGQEAVQQSQELEKGEQPTGEEAPMTQKQKVDKAVEDKREMKKELEEMLKGKTIDSDYIIDMYEKINKMPEGPEKEQQMEKVRELAKELKGNAVERYKMRRKADPNKSSKQKVIEESIKGMEHKKMEEPEIREELKDKGVPEQTIDKTYDERDRKLLKWTSQDGDVEIK